MQSQDFDITVTLPTKVYVCTTGFTQEELSLYKLSENIVLQSKLSISTNYLITYKCLFTPKYIQAYKWQIPIIKPIFLLNNNINRVKLYEGVVFSTENISNEIFKNYFIVQGAIYSESVGLATGFLISDGNSSEKELFCIENNIPIIPTKKVFSNDLEMFVKNEATPLIRQINDNFGLISLKNQNEKKIFSDLIFLIDDRLEKHIFNKLKRLILLNDGKRVNLETKNTNYILSDRNDFKSEKVLFYQFVFDCILANGLILPSRYKIFEITTNNVLNSATFFISDELNETKQIIMNKLVALGGKIKSKNDNYCNYLVTKNHLESSAQKTVTLDWIDKCLYSMKMNKEVTYKIKNIFDKFSYSQPKRKIFQFTGLPTVLKNKAMELLRGLNLIFIDSESFYNEKEKTTHLIMGKINTSEKFLSALANGCWILKPDFIEHFDNSDNFNFSFYEWKLDEYIDKNDRKVVGCIRPWRIYINFCNKPAFHNWRVKFYCDEEKKELYKRIIVNGGGVLDDEEFNLVIKNKEYKGVINEKDVKTTDYIFSYLFRRQT